MTNSEVALLQLEYYGTEGQKTKLGMNVHVYVQGLSKNAFLGNFILIKILPEICFKVFTKFYIILFKVMLI